MTLPPNWRARLREAVKRSGLKQAVIALDSGLTPESVSRILNAQHVRPSFDSIVRITHAAGETVGWLLEEPGFTLTGEQRAKVRTAGVLLVNLTGGLPR